MEYQLEMTFETSLGEKVNLTIRNCKSDINEDQIKALMDTIIAKDTISYVMRMEITNHRDCVQRKRKEKYLS